MATTWNEYKNNAIGQLNASISAIDTSIVLKSGQGAKFPSSGPFVVTIYHSDPDISNELVDVTSRTSDTLTVTRRGGATTWQADDNCALHWLTEEIEAIQDAVNTAEDDIDDIVDGTTPFTGDILPATDSTHSIGSTLKRWLKGWFDSIETTANAIIGGNLEATGTVSGSNIIADGSVTHSTLRWDGSDWVQNANITGTAAGALSTVTSASSGNTTVGGVLIANSIADDLTIGSDLDVTGDTDLGGEIIQSGSISDATASGAASVSVAGVSVVKMTGVGSGNVNVTLTGAQTDQRIQLQHIGAPGNTIDLVNVFGGGSSTPVNQGRMIDAMWAGSSWVVAT